jgi:uncharacterized hydrophobic protein (TIGR00271 family)
MRHVNLRVYEEKQDDVESVLEEHDLDYLAIRDEGDEDEDPGTLFLFPLPSQAVTDVFRDINEVGVSEDAYTVLANASHAATPRYSEIQEEYSTEVRGLSRRELHSKVQELSWPPITYYVGTVLSVIVATTGLLLDSPAVVIGAMVIAPQVSSALTMTTGVYHGDWEMFVEAAKRQSAGLAIAVAGAAVFAWLSQMAGFVPSSVAIDSLELMGIRLAPTSLSSIAALATGAVGAFGYTTDQSMSLVGVMIAAAIVPAAAASGIALAWGSWIVAVGALLLLTVNMLAINVGAVVTLYCMGYQPIWFDRTDLQSTLPSQGVVTIGTIAVLFLLSVVVTGALVGTHIQYERATNTAVDATFDEPQYSGLTLQSVQSQYGGWPGMSPNVSVTVRRTTNENHSSLPGALERRIERQTGREVRVSVQYAETRSVNRSAVDTDAKLGMSSVARGVAA